MPQCGGKGVISSFLAPENAGGRGLVTITLLKMPLITSNRGYESGSLSEADTLNQLDATPSID